ncbi:MAG TPA: Hpt domain-containing protein [Nitrospira sp.]|nr:Hpt domain-containing protein [Nitrospira sp.]
MSIFDLDQALTRVDGDRGLFADLVDMFLRESPKDVGALRAALHRGDSRGVVSAAHKLKGSLMQFCADSVLATAQRMEELGRSDEAGAAAALMVTVETQMLELQDALRRAVDAGPKS